MVKTLYHADLDAGNQVRLVHESTKRREGLQPEERYERISIVVSPRPHTEAKYPLKRIETEMWPSWNKFDFGEIEARTDSNGQHIWFVHRKTGKVIGTVDRKIGQATGPDDVHPVWATVDGGQRLEGGSE